MRRIFQYLFIMTRRRQEEIINMNFKEYIRYDVLDGFKY